MKEVILTGIRSNEEPTLANYLGAFVPMVELQRTHAGKYQINMFVPDLHSFTTPVDHTKLYESTLHNLKYFVAAGLDLDNADTYIYRQSFVPAHSELTWILDCFTYMGEMGRMIQFKDKGGLNPKAVAMQAIEEVRKELGEKYWDRDLDPIGLINQKIDEIKESTASVGLFNYPVLMAADILLYGARWVPVGEDQFQHLEITRDIATRMNNKFAGTATNKNSELFVVPEATAKQTEFMQRDKGLRVRSLTDPTKKMSKSSTDEKSKILLNDNPEVAAKKIMSATTDSVGVINYDWDKQPGVANLLQMLSLLTGRDQAHVNADWEGQTQYGDLKKAVAEAVKSFLVDFQVKYNAIDDGVLLKKLEQDEAAMREVSAKRLLTVQRAVGLRAKE